MGRRRRGPTDSMVIREGSGFPCFLIFSLTAHLLLVLILSFVAPRGHDLGTGPSRLKDDVIKSLSERLSEKLAAAQIPNFPPEDASSALKNVLGRLAFANDVREADRAALAESILESAFGTMAGSSFSSLTKTDADGLDDLIMKRAREQSFSEDPIEIIRQGPGGDYAVHRVKPSIAALIDRMAKEPEPRSVMTLARGQMVLAHTGQGPKEVPAEYYFRSSPLRKMAAVGAGLFTAFGEFADRGDPGHDDALGAKDRTSDGTRTRYPQRTSRIPGTGIVYVSARRAATGPPPVKRAVLILEKSDISAVLDRLMALDVDEQLVTFKKDYLDPYDWDSPCLALLTREFIFNNLNGVFFVLDDLAGAFDQAEELFYKRPVYDFFMRTADGFPGTRTGAEIRFYLAAALDYELRSIQRILAIREEVDAVLKGDLAAPAMFQGKAKALILGQIQQNLFQQLAERRMSPGALADWYLRREQGILSRLAEQSGETRNRALVKWGELLWREEDYDGAVAKWRMVEINIQGYSRSFGQIMEIIDRYGIPRQARQAIDEKLQAEETNGRMDRLNRHLRFHTWKRRSSR